MVGQGEGLSFLRSVIHPETRAFPVAPGRPIVPLGRGDRTVTDGALDVLTLEPGIIGLGDEGRPRGVGRDVCRQPGETCVLLEEFIEGAARQRAAGVLAGFDGEEERRQRFSVMPGSIKILAQRDLALPMYRQSVDLLALGGEFEHPVVAVEPEVPDPKGRRFRATTAGKEIDMQDRAIAQSLERFWIRGLEHGPNLFRGQRRGLAAAEPAGPGGRPTHAGDRVDLAELLVGEKLVERGKRAETVGDAGIAQAAIPQVIPERDHMRLGDTIECRGTGDPHGLDEIAYGPSVGGARVLGREVREPETLGRNNLERVLIIEITRRNRPHQLLQFIIHNLFYE